MNMQFLPPRLKVLEKLDYFPRPLLRKLVDGMWEEVKVHDLEVLLLTAQMECYRCGEGLVLIKTEDWPQGRELLLYGVAGRGIMKKAEDLLSDLEALARYKSCSMIGTHVSSRGFDKLFRALGAKPVSTHYVKEL